MTKKVTIFDERPIPIFPQYKDDGIEQYTLLWLCKRLEDLSCSDYYMTHVYTGGQNDETTD